MGAAAIKMLALIDLWTRYFTGREWVFDAVSAWLENPAGPPNFLLAGGPGSGKTAIAARLAQMSLGRNPRPAPSPLRPGFLDHVHFCQARRDSTLSPLTFVEELSKSLANRHPAFLEALKKRAVPQVNISSVVNTGDVAAGAQVAGTMVNIEILGGDAGSMFDELVGRPLADLCEAQPGVSVVVLVDSLDEALGFHAENNVVQLLRRVQDLPDGVRFLLTCRSNTQRVFDMIGEPALDLLDDAPAAEDEVKAYALIRLAALPETDRQAVAGRVARKSGGNFLYAQHVLTDLVDGRAAPGDELPESLEAVYERFLEREMGRSRERWTGLYRPLLGAIAVARGEGLDRGQLSGITGLAADQADDVLEVSRPYLVGGETADAPYRIYHQSFREFLVAPGRFDVYAGERHAAIADFLLRRHGKSWSKCQDPYALRFTPVHLAEAARSAAPERRDGYIGTLVTLAANRRFQDRCDELLHDLPLLHGHAALALRAASWSDADEMLPALMSAARGLQEFRRQFLRGEPVMAVAEQGLVDKAAARLPLFEGLDRDWQAAASLILAWLAMTRNRPGAQALRDRVAALGPGAEPLPLLLERLDGALAGRMDHPFELTPSRGLRVSRELVRRISGQDFDRELLADRANLAALVDQQELIEAGGYSASLDGPVLVGTAREMAPEGTALLDDYIDAHAGYNYVHYRNRSLWVVLQAVLRHHPDQAWVLDRCRRMLVAAMHGGGADFAEAAPLAVAVLLKRAEGSHGRDALDAFTTQAEAALTTLAAGRGANDSFSLHKRRLTAIMEVEALALEDTARAAAMLARIEQLEGAKILEGYGGFQAPAELRLADALRACGLEGGGALERRLLVALQRAHHIQDFHFCARITARCNALRRWHAQPFAGPALVQAIERLAESPTHVDFSADHYVNEAYEYRPNDSDTLSIAQAQSASSLDRLADVFQRPAVDFLSLNPGSGARDVLPGGTLVHVPDPGLPPLLAAHLLARTWSDASLRPQRARLMRLLVPVAAVNAIALDTVLAYLFIAADPEDAGILATLVKETGPAEVTDVAVPPGRIGPDGITMVV